MIEPVMPAVYKLIKGNDGHYLEYYKPMFEVSGKNYGDINRHIEVFWDAYTSKTVSLGVLLTGAAGSGKTRTAELLGNRAIMHNMIVVMVTEIVPDLETIKYIDLLTNAVIIFDEFGKVFDMKLQNKMLTMLSNVNSYKKLFILTENSKNIVSPFILNRPGRVRYHIDYDRIKESTILEYTADYPVNEKFLNELLKLHAKSNIFSFDHLQALVSEHRKYPDLTLEELLEILNLSMFNKQPHYRAVEMYDEDGNTYEIAYTEPVTKVVLFSKRSLWVDYFLPKDDSNKEPKEFSGERPKTIQINKTDVHEIDDENGTILFKKGNFYILFKEVE